MSRSVVSITTATFAAVALAGAAPAFAQSTDNAASVPAEGLRPALDRDGLLGMESAVIPPHLASSAVVWMGHGAAPVTSPEDGDLVSGRIGGGVAVAVGLGRRAEVGLDLPLVIYQWRHDEPRGAGDLDAAGVGDVRLAVKFGLPTVQRAQARLAALVAVTLPSGGGASYLGEQGKTVAVELVASRELGRGRVAVNLGYHLRPANQALDVIVDDDLIVRLGAARRVATRIAGPLDLQTSLVMRFGAGAPFDGDRAVIEWLAAADYQLGGRIDAFAGTGLGLTGGAGAADWRVLAGLRYGFQLDTHTTPGTCPCELASSRGAAP